MDLGFKNRCGVDGVRGANIQKILLRREREVQWSSCNFGFKSSFSAMHLYECSTFCMVFPSSYEKNLFPYNILISPIKQNLKPS